GGGGGIFGEPGGEPERRDKQEMMQDIIDLIEQQTANDADWEDLTGGKHKIQPYNLSLLIVTTTPKVHRQIEGLLSQLRTIRALQINIEGRLISVSLDWFEQIGIDFDLYFNTNPGMYDYARDQDPNMQLRDFFFQNVLGSATPNPAAGHLKEPLIMQGMGQTGTGNQTATGNAAGTGAGPGGGGNITYGQLPPTNGGFYNPIGIRKDGDAYGAYTSNGMGPVNIQQQGLPLINTLGAAGLSTFGLAALATPTLTSSFTYLDDVQVDLLVQATSADQRNVVLNAPRLTMFNGQRSWISVAKAISYVSNLTPVTGDASGGFAPTIGVVYEGFVLDVEAVVSADRRYVTMTVQFGLNENVKFETVPVTGAVGGDTSAGGRGSQFGGTIQLPSLSGTQIATTVSVPDKGTILLGGQRRVSDIEIEVGVPVLSKIPFVNRFFTNRLSSKTESNLLLLIRPEVIIQQEAENELFPDLRNEVGAAAVSGF
ncbi:MAG: hypothetical protein EXS00_05915, partial [Phycisphaerales bacterium]|nr:hypothetical protein [Phycisphaerales bacterium]